MFWPKISLAKRSTGEVLITGACLYFTSVMVFGFCRPHHRGRGRAPHFQAACQAPVTDILCSALINFYKAMGAATVDLSASAKN
jgi:hypothetical protein